MLTNAAVGVCKEAFSAHTSVGTRCVVTFCIIARDVTVDNRTLVHVTLTVVSGPPRLAHANAKDWVTALSTVG